VRDLRAGGRWGLRLDGWTLLMVVVSGSTLGYAFLPV
jgi:hypothetical protein